MPRRLPRWTAVLLILSGLAAGCGGGGVKNQNKDADRPRPTMPSGKTK